LVVKAAGLKVAAAVRKGDEEFIMIGIWYNGFYFLIGVVDLRRISKRLYGGCRGFLR